MDIKHHPRNNYIMSILVFYFINGYHSAVQFKKKKQKLTTAVTVIQSLSPVWLIATLWTTAHQVYLSSTVSCPMNWWCYLTISSSITLFFYPQSFPASGYFPKNQFFASGGQSTRALASACLSMNIQHWFPLGKYVFFKECLKEYLYDLVAC